MKSILHAALVAAAFAAASCGPRTQAVEPVPEPEQGARTEIEATDDQAETPPGPGTTETYDEPDEEMAPEG